MTRKKKKISILGCGWVGNALKVKLESIGDEVYCLSRDVKMNTFLGFYACDTLIIAIPPSDRYLDVIDDVYFYMFLNKAFNPQVILLSSISFYDDKKIIIGAEKLAKLKNSDTVILRLGGLMGYDRIAGKYTAGKTIENTPTNYVHRDDVVGIIESIIEKRVKNKTFNVVAPIQSTKKEIYIQNASSFGFEKTSFKGLSNKTKSLSSEILCKVLGYEFVKKDVKNFWS